MDKYDIGGFAIWEENSNGDPVIRYLDDNVYRLTKRQLDIFNVIIENTINYDTYITAKQIADELNKRNKPDHDRETIKHALRNIKQKEGWNSVIESSPNGYLIKCSKVSSETQETAETEEPIPVSKSTSELSASKKGKDLSSFSNRRTEQYISNFIRNNEQTWTYYYKASSHNVTEVLFPLTLINNDDYSKVELSIEKLYENDNRYRYVITGPVGSGKSLFAKKLALDAANDYSIYGVIPILYDLKKFDESDKSLFELLREEYASYIPEDEPSYAGKIINTLLPNSEFSQYCQSGSVFLLFDGYDELSPSLKNQFLTKLKAFMRSYSNNSILLFTRPFGSFVELGAFSVLSIKNMNMEQVSSFVDMFIEPTDDEERFVKNKILQKNDLLLFSSDLYSNPLFLTIIASRYKNFFLFDSDFISESMEKFIMYITCEDKLNTPRYSKAGLTPSQFKSIMCSFCRFLVENNIDSFDVDDIENYRRVSPNNDFYAEEFCDDLCRMYGLTYFDNGKYKFIDGLIVEYFYVLNLLNTEPNLITLWRAVENCYAYSMDSVLDLLVEMDKAALFENIYVPFNNDYCVRYSESEYRRFLSRFYPKIKYYVGEGDYKVNNNRSHVIYRHMIRDLNVEQDISHLEFPPFEQLKQTAVFEIGKREAAMLGMAEGLVEEDIFNIERIKALGLTPVGYIYVFKTYDALNRDDEVNTALREVLMSSDFPLQKEFKEASIYCDNIENGDVKI